MSWKKQINLEKLPAHIAIIMDGNGRWAKKFGKSRILGHRKGAKAVQETVEACAELGIEFLSLFAFSTENWKRPKTEINALMTLLINTINRELKSLNKNNIKLRAIGNLEALPSNCYKTLLKAIDSTKNNNRLNLILALSYSSRWEITNTAKNIVKDIIDKKIQIDAIDEPLMNSYLCTSDIPDPELLIRTSGEYRISNFLLWQIAYSELYFTPTLWPDFDKEELYKAIANYQKRERRFGKISEQIEVE